MPPRIYMNGEIVAPADAKISIFDRGFLYGDSIYETLRVYDGEPFAFAAHLERVRHQHEEDLAAGLGAVALPDALARKYPNASRAWAWQWVFPSARHYADRETGELRRHHRHESTLQRDVRRAVLASGISKRATCHRFDTLLQHTCSRRERIFARSRNCWVTTISAQQ